MSQVSLFVLALALAMDATAAAAAQGWAAQRIGLRESALVALYFGGSQALMPWLGCTLGAWLGSIVSTLAPWLAFALLSGLGAKMLLEAREAQGRSFGADPFAARAMALLALATSIDAFAAGVSLPLLHAPLLFAIATIGVTTALLSVAGLWVGGRFGALFGNRLAAGGGLVLILLGVKALLEAL